LLACLRSLAHHLPCDVPVEVIVVINVDARACVTALRDGVTGVREVRSDVNLGLAGAVNCGRALASGELLVLLHDDAQIEPGWLEALVEAADGHPEAGAIGCKVLALDGSLESAGMILWRDGTTACPWIGPAPPPTAFDRPRTVDYCGTSALLVRAATWDAIGGADEGFFPAYYVDVDLAMAIRRHGQAVLYQPAARIRHHRSASTGARFRTFVSARNRRRFLAKWQNALAAQEPRGEGTLAAFERAIVRAEAAGDALCRGASVQLESSALPESPASDVAADRARRALVMDLTLHQEYAAELAAALESAHADIVRLHQEIAARARATDQQLAALRARSAVLASLERGRVWGLYLRVGPFLRRVLGRGKGE
jgi:GT2 family glycosyltransferase